MDIKALYNSGATYKEFTKQENGDYEKKINEINDSMSIDDDLKLKIQAIKKKINVIVFGEIWCPDCVINIPALNKISELNNNVNIRIVSRKGNENFLDDFKIDGKAKIPTFLIYDEDFNYKSCFIEQPKIVKNIMKNGDQVEVIVSKRKYRKGEYCLNTIEEILESM